MYFFSFPLTPTPLIPSFPSLKLDAISSIVIYLNSSVNAIFYATLIVSKESINILEGEDAKFAPADIRASK